MPDVRLPDGTIVTNVPAGVTQADLIGRVTASRAGRGESPLQNVPGSPTERPTSGIVSSNATRTFLDNMLSLPAAAGDLASRALVGGAGLAQTVAETPHFGLEGFGNRLQGNMQAQSQQFPANALSNIPRPSTNDLTSAAQSLPSLAPGGETPQNAFTRNLAATEQAQILERQQRPGAVGLGEVVGDVATLATGRQPFAKNLVNSSRGLPSVSNRVTRESLEAIAREQPDLVPQIAELIGSGRLAAPGTQRLWRRIAESGPVQSSLRGLGKVAESSLEGAVMASIKENDPVLNAGLAGGAQLATSVAGTVLGVPKSFKDLAYKAAGYLAFFRLAQEFGPGENNTFTATDSAFDKLAMAMTIGVSSQVLGGRFRGSGTLGKRFAEDLPRFSDALNSIPRGVFNSLLNQIQQEQESGNSLTLPTLERLSTNPLAFPEGIRNRLQRAMRSNNLPQEIERLKDNEAFTNVLDGTGNQQ